MATDNANSAALLTKENSDGNGASRLSATVSLARKIGLPGYGHVDAFFSVSGITADTTEEDIRQIIDATKIPWKVIAEAVNSKAIEEAEGLATLKAVAISQGRK